MRTLGPLAVVLALTAGPADAGQPVSFAAERVQAVQAIHLAIVERACEVTMPLVDTFPVAGHCRGVAERALDSVRWVVPQGEPGELAVAAAVHACARTALLQDPESFPPCVYQAVAEAPALTGLRAGEAASRRRVCGYADVFGVPRPRPFCDTPSVP
jgi:hypothetical protein